MADTKVIMPQMGESIFEGTITKWLKKAGERVERDEPLFEISTDKVDSEIPAPAAGVVKEILVKEGQTVQINTVVAIIGDGDMKAAEAKPAAPVSAAPPKPAEQPRPAPAAPQPVAQPQAQPQTQPQTQPVTVSHGDLRSSPLVRRIAKENNVTLNALSGKGTGINGRITKRDILSYIEQGRACSGATAAPSARSSTCGNAVRGKALSCPSSGAHDLQRRSGTCPDDEHAEIDCRPHDRKPPHLGPCHHILRSRLHPHHAGARETARRIRAFRRASDRDSVLCPGRRQCPETVSSHQFVRSMATRSSTSARSISVLLLMSSGA